MAKKSGRKAGPRPASTKAPRPARVAPPAPVARPFEGLAAECDLVALREFVPSATARLTTVAPGRELLLATVLPMASAALVREADLGGQDAPELGILGLQVQQVPSEDLSRDLGRALAWALTAEAGQSLPSVDTATDGPRLQDLLEPSAQLEITVHDDFDWWVPGGASDPEVSASLERATQAIMPTAAVEGVRGAWWTDAGEKAHVRWVRPEAEDALMPALARVHAAGALTLGEGSRFAGSFRAHGLLVPVFDVDRESHAQEWAQAVAALGAALDEALTDDGPLTPAQRRSRDGLRARQVTIR